MTIWRLAAASPWLLLSFGVLYGVASAKTLEVGPDLELKTPSAAAKIAADGDTIEIGPGEYYDCAVWNAANLTIVGQDGATITDVSCQGKALFVIVGHDVTIRNLTFARARVPDGNGAGIRAEGRNLTIEHSRFINNENGILAADMPDGTITIRSSEFVRNGKCDATCAHGVYANRLALLRIEQSSFTGTRAGDAIRSRALRTELAGNSIADGKDGTAAYLVELPNGGSLIMQDNTLEKASPTPRGAAVMLGGEAPLQPSAELRFSRNRLVDDSGKLSAFVLDWSGGSPVFAGNTLPPTVAEVSSRGGAWHDLRSAVGRLRDDLRWIVGSAIRLVRRLV
ncbi:MAG: hypothetical protein JWL84_2708 [Rhodospirillales bacterium]|nr:hypothetical protein [Rhodospirillales bacterium]